MRRPIFPTSREHEHKLSPMLDPGRFSEGPKRVQKAVLIVPRALCCCSRAQGDQLFFDWRANSKFTLLTVNETAPEAVPEVRQGGARGAAASRQGREGGRKQAAALGAA